MLKLKINILHWHSFQSGEFLESYPNFSDTEPHDKKVANNRSISEVDELEYHKCNSASRRKTTPESPPRPRRHYQHQQWSRKDSMIRRKRNTTPNYNVFDRRKRQYVL